MIDSLQSAETMLASVYQAGIQAKELDYNICVSWKHLIIICQLAPGHKYNYLHDTARKEYVKGYRNGKPKR